MTGGTCDANCPAGCKVNEMFCMGGEDASGCRLPDYCMPFSEYYPIFTILYFI